MIQTSIELKTSTCRFRTKTGDQTELYGFIIYIGFRDKFSHTSKRLNTTIHKTKAEMANRHIAGGAFLIARRR